jgi:hypothetical protein
MWAESDPEVARNVARLLHRLQAPNEAPADENETPADE